MTNLRGRLEQLEKRMDRDNGRGENEWVYMPLGDVESNVGYWRAVLTGEPAWEIPEGGQGQRPVYLVGRVPLLNDWGYRDAKGYHMADGTAYYIGDKVGRYVPYVPPLDELDACLAEAPPELPAFPEVWELGRWRALMQRSKHLDLDRSVRFDFVIPEKGSYFGSMMFYFSLTKDEAFSTDDLTDFAAVKGLTLDEVGIGGITTKLIGDK